MKIKTSIDFNHKSISSLEIPCLNNGTLASVLMPGLACCCCWCCCCCA